jgi:carboxylesterase type B
VYSFDWATPVFGGLLGACHALDLAFAFDNLGAAGVGQFTGDSPERTLVADAYAGAIARFVATGDPGWPAYDTDRRAVQRFDAQSEVVDDPEPELRQLWARR